MNLKKLLLICSLMLALTPKAFSQLGGYGTICFDCIGSIEVGAVSSNVKGIGPTSSKPGFYIGFYSFKEINDNFALRFGANYTNHGAKLKDANYNLNIHSLRGALSLHYFIKQRYQVFGGGDFGGNFSKGEGSLDDEIYSKDGIKKGVVNLLDASVFMGAGIIVAEKIDISLKYNLGVTNLNDYKEGNAWKANWITLSVGYTFRD